jgi:hypothetical protein
VRERLVVVEEDARFVVAFEDDVDDWVCAFAKSESFPAERWAFDMVRTWNARVELSRTSSRRRPAASGP